MATARKVERTVKLYMFANLLGDPADLPDDVVELQRQAFISMK